MVHHEINNYGYQEQKKKLIAGIVLTGGGSILKHIKQVVELHTGMDTRVGYPNEHLANSDDEDIPSPMFATAVGLILRGWDEGKYNDIENIENEEELDEQNPQEIKNEPKENLKNIFKTWTEKFLHFLSDEETQKQDDN